MAVETWTPEMLKAHAKGQHVPKVVSKASAPTRQKFKGRGVGRRYGKRHVPGVMNKTEEKFADLLQERKKNGEVIEWLFESVTLKLADGCRFTPDFFVVLADGSIELIDVKGTGPVDDKSIVKIKCAAERFFEFRFVMEKQQTRKNGGGWKRTEY